METDRPGVQLRVDHVRGSGMAIDAQVFPIRAEGLTKRFGQLVAVDGVSLDLAAGERLALLGRNGAGKTTLLRLVAGLARPDAGHIGFGHYTLPEHRAEIHAATGFLSHHSLLYPDLCVWENLSFAARLFGVKEADQRIEDSLSRVGMLEWRRERVRHLSSGMERRVALARALLHRPQVLILDEPFAGLDARSVGLLQEVLEEHRAGGGTVLLTTHHHEEGTRDATRAVILERGRIAYDGTRRDGGFAGFGEAYSRLVEQKG